MVSTLEKGDTMRKNASYSIMMNMTASSYAKRSKTYPNIDMKRTGTRLKKLFESAGYTPKMIQQYLHLSCPQPIYRWYKGLILPSVDHLLMLSELLGLHMEELLVKKQRDKYILDFSCDERKTEIWNIIMHYEKLKSIAA